MSKDRRLGRGLAALLGTVEGEESIDSPVASHPRVPAPHFSIAAASETAQPQVAPPDSEALLKLSVHEIDDNPYQPRREFSEPEIASLNMGTMNFGLYPMLERFKEFKYDWEKPYLEASRAGVFKNTFADIEYILTKCAESGTRFEIECYDIGHLYTLAHFVDRGIVKGPFFVQSVFGLLGGIGGHPEDVMHMKRTADRLFGDQYQWSVLGAGRNQMQVAAMSAAMGGNVRVGMEDSLWIGAGKLAQSNAEQVTKVRQIIEGLGLEIATPDDAREMLQLKGGDRVNF